MVQALIDNGAAVNTQNQVERFCSYRVVSSNWCHQEDVFCTNEHEGRGTLDQKSDWYTLVLGFGRETVVYPPVVIGIVPVTSTVRSVSASTILHILWPICSKHKVWHCCY